MPVIAAQAATEVRLIERLLDIQAQAVTVVGLIENSPVSPAQAGIQKPGAPVIKPLDSRLRGNDRVL